MSAPESVEYYVVQSYDEDRDLWADGNQYLSASEAFDWADELGLLFATRVVRRWRLA